MPNLEIINRYCTLTASGAVLVAMLHASPLSAGWDEGLAASKAGDHQRAYEELMPLAEQGHGSAQSMIGVMYYNGEGVPQDFDAAIVWLTLAANQGYSVAQFNLGVMYDNGQGVEQDFTQAFKWYRHAAEQGHPNAQYNLGAMYAGGDGVEQDPARAYMWYSIASAHGNQQAADNRKQLEKSLSTEERAAAQQMTGACIDSKYQNC